MSNWNKIEHQLDYIKGVYNKMRTCKDANRNAHVRIGVMGHGAKPCYRIFHVSPSGGEVIYGSWWDMHDPLDNPDAVTNNWSAASMNFEQVENFLFSKFPQLAKFKK